MEVFFMGDLSKILSVYLNKTDFITELTEMGEDLQVIEEEWDKIEQIFILLFVQIAYNSLSDSDKSGLALQLSSNPTPEEISKFTEKVSTFLKNNPGAIDYGLVGKQASEETLRQYVKFYERLKK